MGINKVEVYTMTCDKCGKGLYPNDDMIFHEDTHSLEFVAEESQWKQQLDGKWYCPECWNYLFED